MVPEQWKTLTDRERLAVIGRSNSEDLARFCAPEWWRSIPEEKRLAVIEYSYNEDLARFRTPEWRGTLTERERIAVIRRSRSSDLAELWSLEQWGALAENERLAVIEQSHNEDLTGLRSPGRWGTLTERERHTIRSRIDNIPGESNISQPERVSIEDLQQHPAWNAKPVQDKINAYREIAPGAEGRVDVAYDVLDAFEDEFREVNRQRQDAGESHLNPIPYVNAIAHAYVHGYLAWE